MKNLITPKPHHINLVKEACDAPWCIEDDHDGCVPATVEPIAAYALVVKRSHLTRDGAYWEGDIYKDGTKIMGVVNDGDGGPNQYFGVNTHWADKDDFNAFKDAAAAAFPTVPFEVEDILVGFLDTIANLIVEPK